MRPAAAAETPAPWPSAAEVPRRWAAARIAGGWPPSARAARAPRGAAAPRAAAAAGLLPPAAAFLRRARCRGERAAGAARGGARQQAVEAAASPSSPSSARPAPGGPAEHELPAEDRWITGLDLEGFGREMEELGRQLRAQQGEEDLAHLHRVVLWSDACFAAGLATMWLEPNPVTALFFCLWSHSRWTMIAHHSLHGGYNKLDSTRQYSSSRFGRGSLSRRALDWFDWMLPEAWSVYHNQVHHYRVNERADPDLFEDYVSTWKLPKEFMTILSMLVFKWAFAAPNSYKDLKLTEMRKSGRLPPRGFDPGMTMTIYQVYRLERDGQGIFSLAEFAARVVGPYLLLHFVLLPLPLALVDPALFWHALGNLALGEVFANLWGYAVTSFNHTGDDVYRFERSCRPHSPTFYLRAVIGSVNCRTGGEVNDFLHGYLNYQIEHHLWPDLSMLAYSRAQPRVRAICEKHGVPYVQDDIFSRLLKVWGIFTGRAHMRRFPDHLEREADMMVWSDRAVPHARAR